MSVVPAGSCLEGVALGPRCPQRSIPEALGLASSCLYVTWETWGWGQSRWAEQRTPGFGRNLHGRAGSGHRPHRVGTGSCCWVEVRACARDLTHCTAHWFVAGGARGRESR